MSDKGRQNRPDFRLSLGDQDLRGSIYDEAAQLLDITAKVRPRLVQLSLTEKRGGEADQLDVVLDDADGGLALPRKGQILRLQLGWAAGADVVVGLVDKGAFTVDEVQWSGAPDQVRITARSADLAGAFRIRREAGYKATTLGAIARTVAARNGYRVRIAPELADVAVPVLAQHQVSDMALLRRLGREHDAVATVKHRTLIMSPVGRGLTSSGTALPALTITRTDGSGYSYREVDRTQDAGVEARWHDPTTATRHTVTSGTSGSNAGGHRHRLRRVYHSAADAQAAADAADKAAKRTTAEFEITLALGRPDLYPQRPAKLAGFKPPIDAHRWIVAELTHSMSGQGLTTQLKLEAS